MQYKQRQINRKHRATIKREKAKASKALAAAKAK
jgi:hypothetical protein